MITEEQISSTLQLFSIGYNQAEAILFANASQATADGRTDAATFLMDLSEQFFELVRKGLESGEEIENLRTISISLRCLAHRLHKEFGEKADDPRLLHLVRPEHFILPLVE